MKRIASVAVMAGDRLLIGKRSDDQRWNLPGGHVDEGESPEQGAARELEEETGIKASAKELMQIARNVVTTFTGKTIEVSSYLLLLPHTVDTKREGTDPGEAHDWAWTNISNGLPPDIAQNWHNKTDSTMSALGLMVCTNDAMDKFDLVEDDYLEKAWPREYSRVKGQHSGEGAASKKQLNYMKAKAAEGDQDAKDYVKNSPKSGDGLPDEGSGGARGERERGRGKKKEKEKAHDGAKKSEEDIRGEAIKRMNRPKVASFGQQVATIKEKYKQKEPKSFDQQVSEVKARYKKPLEKQSDLFYAKVEGLLEKGYSNEELVSHLMDTEVLMRAQMAKSDDQDNSEDLRQFYVISDRFFDAAMSKEEQTVYELAYLAREGCKHSALALEKFAIDMYDEMVKHTSVENAVGDMVAEAIEKSNYGPKKIGGEKVSLYSNTDNINRKANRTGVVHENVGRNVAEQKFTPSVQGTFAEQAKRESAADRRKSKANPVKVYTAEEKAKLQADYKAKNPDHKIASDHCEDLDELIGEHKRLTHVLDTPSHQDDKVESKKQKKELKEYEAERANKSEDNSKVKGKVNGASYRMVHGYKRYTSGPKRGEYVHRHEAEKRIGRKLGSKEHVDHTSANRSGTKNTKVMSASAHSAKTNKDRAKNGGHSGPKRYEHTRD